MSNGLCKRADPAIAKAQRRLEELMQDDEFMHNYTLRMMAQSDWTTGVNTAFEKGVEKGIEQGIEKGIEQGIEQGIEKGIEQGIEKGVERGRRETAKALKGMGVSVEMIAASTGLAMDAIAAL